MSVLLFGYGFQEAGISKYAIGSVLITDTGNNVDVNGSYGPTGSWIPNSRVRMTIPLSSDAFGAITAATSGGTSAPFTRTLSSIASTALSGTAADPAKASANAGQAVTLVGSGLANTRILLGYTDYFGRERFEWVATTNPSSDGMSAGISIPNLANGLLKVWLLGSSSRLELQIVPTITSVTVNAYGMVEIQGSGFVEGASTYELPNTIVVDDLLDDSAWNAGGIDVDWYGNDRVLISSSLIPSGLGTGVVRVRTLGGTSASRPV